MNAYNPLASMKRLEEAGLPRLQAEAIAAEIGEGTTSLVTKVELDAALDRQAVRLGGFLTAVIALATAVLGLLISIK